jgi:tRNA threonylcarbamoyladenosine biosynthesis protein TsaB
MSSFNLINQYALALHTTSPQLGLSLNNFADVNRTQTWNLDRELSTYLHQYLLEFLIPQTWQDLAFIAVAKGPGSFTSTRIGVVTARTLAQQLEIPLFAVSTLMTLAFSKCDRHDKNKTFAVQIEATRGQLYVGIYQISDRASKPITLLPDTLMTSEAWQEKLEKLETSYQLIVAPTHLGLTCDSLLELAYLDWQAGDRPHWSEALPFYGG